MSQNAETIVERYSEAYEQLYQRPPKEIYVLDPHWVIVNGARMSVKELEFLTEQMKVEYSESLTDKRNLVKRLLHWLKGA